MFLRKFWCFSKFLFFKGNHKFYWKGKTHIHRSYCFLSLHICLSYSSPNRSYMLSTYRCYRWHIQMDTVCIWGWIEKENENFIAIHQISLLFLLKESSNCTHRKALFPLFIAIKSIWARCQAFSFQREPIWFTLNALRLGWTIAWCARWVAVSTTKKIYKFSLI